MVQQAVMDPQTAQPPGGTAQQRDSRAAAPPPVVAPFVRAAHEHNEPFVDTSNVLTANTLQLGPFDVIAYGYMRHIWLLVQATGGVSAVTTAKAGDAPWSALQTVQLSDVNGAPIVGPLNGYDLMIINKYGGYVFANDPNMSPAFSDVVVGASASGNFSFDLRIPVEIVQRDGLGALPNQNSAAAYKLSIIMNNAAGIYTTAPNTTLPTVRIRAWLEAWSQPTPTDLRGMPQATVPPAMGTTQFWSKFIKGVASGAQTIQLPRVGNLLRKVIFILYNNGTPSVRTTADFPDPIQIAWDGRILLNESRLFRQRYMYERNDYAGATGGLSGAAAVQLDVGVFDYSFAHEVIGKTGAELRDLYLATTQASRLEIVGSFGAAASSLIVLTNDVAPAGEIVVAA